MYLRGVCDALRRQQSATISDGAPAAVTAGEAARSLLRALTRHAGLALADPAVHGADRPAAVGPEGSDNGATGPLLTRALFGVGAEVTAHRGHVILKPLTPVPAVSRSLRLHPAEPDDPRVYRVEFKTGSVSYHGHQRSEDEYGGQEQADVAEYVE